MTNIFCAYAVI